MFTIIALHLPGIRRGGCFGPIEAAAPRAILLLALFFLLPRALDAQPLSSKRNSIYASRVRLHEFADEMLAKGMIDSVTYMRLDSATVDGGITSSFDLLSYLPRTTTIDLTTLPEEPEEFYPIIFDRIRSIVPGFDFRDLRITRRPTEELTDDDDGNIIITMTIGAREYAQVTTFLEKSLRGEVGKYLGEYVRGYGGMIGRDYHEIVNKWLADEGAEYRLHTVDYRIPLRHATYDEIVTAEDRIGLVTLTASGYENLEKYRYGSFKRLDGEALLTIEPESFDTLLGARGIERVIAAYRELGLFRHLSEREIAEGTKRALQSMNRDVNDIAARFRDVVAEIWLMTTTERGDYARAIQRIAAITHGAFTPKKIRDDYYYLEPRPSTVAFDFSGRTYRDTIEFDDDAIDPDFLALVDSAIARNIPDRRLYTLLEEDATELRMIFLTREQHDMLKSRKLLHFYPENPPEAYEPTDYHEPASEEPKR